MKRLAALMVGGLVLGGCGSESESTLSFGSTSRSADGQTVVSEYFGSKGFIITDEYLETNEGGAVASALRRQGVRYLTVLTGSNVPLALQRAIGGVEVHGWNRTRWARDVGPMSAVSHSSEDLRLLQLGRIDNVTRAIAKWLGRAIVEGPSLPAGASLMVNAYADCFLAKVDGVSGDLETEMAAAFRDKAGCRRVTMLPTLPKMTITKHLDQWVRFLSNDAVAVARLVDLSTDKGLSDSPALLDLRKFWDDEARAMRDRGYQVTRLPVFVHREGNTRVFFSTMGGLLVKRVYLAPEFPSLQEAYGLRYEVEQDALEREMRLHRFTVEWVKGEDSARLGGSIHRAVLPIHEN